MDPTTGEILALAGVPALDPNDYGPWLGEDSEDEPVIDPAVGGQYEPGSTFKVLTMAAAIDAGMVLPDDEFVDTGEIEVGGHTIRNWDGEAWGPQTMVGCLEHSLNVCLAYVASERLGAELLYDYLAEFGVGRLTGVDLAGEVPGQLRTPTHPDWTESDLGTNAFGQGVSVTPMQLLAAVSAVANNGQMVQPHVVGQVVSSEGAYWPGTTVIGRPISARTAQTLTDMLVESLANEALLADLDGYTFAGKTGTAQIPSDYGYDPNLTIASFIGWGPLPNPRFMVLVRIDQPHISPWGSVIAAPAFQQVAQRLVVLMGIPPEPVRAAMAGGG
jgi:cell division protein FtsI/penicillin-binding protein 2